MWFSEKGNFSARCHLAKQAELFGSKNGLNYFVNEFDDDKCLMNLLIKSFLTTSISTRELYYLEKGIFSAHYPLARQAELLGSKTFDDKIVND